MVSFLYFFVKLPIPTSRTCSIINTILHISKLLILALNSSTVQTEVTLIDFDNSQRKTSEKNRKKAGTSDVLFEKSWLSQKDEAERILPSIQEALQKSKVQIADLDAIFIVNGPGHFSGLRIGVTIANAFAFSIKKPLLGCSTFELLQQKILPPKRKETAIVIGGGGPHFAVQLPGRKKIQLCEEGELIKTIDAQENLHFLLVDLKAHQLEKLQELLTSSNKPIELLPKKFTRKFSEAVGELFPEKSKQKHKIIAPRYLQKPNITKSKKQVFTKKSKICNS